MLTIEVFGLPAPQGSKRVFNGRVVEASAKTLKPWRKAVSVACHNLQLDELLTGPVKVEVRIFLPRPKTVTIKKRFLPIVPPDVDKLCRSILDGIGQNIAGDCECLALGNLLVCPNCEVALSVFTVAELEFLDCPKTVAFDYLEYLRVFDCYFCHVVYLSMCAGLQQSLLPQ